MLSPGGLSIPVYTHGVSRHSLNWGRGALPETATVSRPQKCDIWKNYWLKLLVKEVTPLEPVYLSPDVAVDDITLLVLEAPGNDDKKIPFTYPEALLDLALDPPGPCNTVLTTDPYVVCPEHQISPGEYLPVSSFR